MLLSLLFSLSLLAYLFYKLIWVKQRLPVRSKIKRRVEERIYRESLWAEDRAFEQRENTNVEPVAKHSSKHVNSFVVDFSEVGKDDADDVGGKGANLGELASAGLPVPGGFCITKAACLASSSGQKDRVFQAIKDAYAKLGDGSSIVAVRSSATCEDSQEASFAGQLESYLGIQGEDRVLEAVEKCWDSLNSQRVQAYQKQQLLPSSTGGIVCCVVVQKMVDAKCAGVMFTANPLSKKRQETVISASWGLGEAVVSDLITPDTWVVDTQSKKVLNETISTSKTRMYVMDKKTYAGSIVVDVDPPKKDAPCLSNEQLSELVDMGQTIEKLYRGSPRDIEWAIDGDSGKLLILQARPITTNLEEDEMEPVPTINEFDSPCRPGDWITRSNAAEMFPGAGTPLSMSTFGRGANYAVQGMHCAFGVRDEVDENEAVVGWFYGNQFLNMTNTLRVMCGGMIGAKMGKENGEMSILGRFNDECTVEDLLAANTEKFSIARRLLNGMRYVVTSFVAVPTRVPRLHSRVDMIKERIASLQEDATAEEVWNCLDDLQSDYMDQWTDGVTVSSVSAAFMLAVMKLLCLSGKYKPWSTEAIADVTALISSQEEEEVAESCDAVKSLDRIADGMLAKSKKEAESFASMAVEDACKVLKQSDDFVQFLERHGHRCIKESELRTSEWSEDPESVVKLLQSSVKARLVSGGVPVRSAKVTAEGVLKERGAVLKTLLQGASHFARIGVRNRELGKSLCIAFHTQLKKGYRKLGELLFESNRLHDADLVYFLTHAELGAICGNHVPERTITRLKNRALKRRRLLPLQENLRFKGLYKGKPEPIQPESLSSEENAGKSVKGTPVCTGVAIGKARVVRTLEEANTMEPGEILVCIQTDVGWTPYFSLAGALVTEIGGLLSHGAVVAREYGLPCIVNVHNACNRFKTGQLLKLDGETGTVEVIEEATN